MANSGGVRALRVGVVMAVLGTMAACGPSQAEKEEAARLIREECLADHNMKVTERSGNCDIARRSGEDEERDVKQRVLDGVNEVARQGGNGSLVGATGWSIAINDLGRNQWRWTEREAAIVADDYDAIATMDTFEYTVNPADLETTFQTATYRDWPAVEMRCRDGKACIRVRGVTETGETVFDNSNRQAVDERRTSNLWPVGSNSGSGRVAQALSELVKVQSRSEPEVCKPLPEPTC